MKQRHRWLVGVLVVIALAALVLIAPGKEGALAQGDTIYVDADADGAKNGDSWTDAYTDLQLALAEAGEEDQIWVAAGTYKPTAEHGGSGDRYRSFQMKNGVAIYGGFDPTVGDIAWEDRDWVAHPTILSGDLNGDDGPDFENNDENSYHVFYHPVGTDLDGTAILDGFTITGGNADVNGYGGGIYNDASSPTLTNCTFWGNWADNGGGMYNGSGSSPALTDCAFSGNSAQNRGAGMFNGSGSAPLLTDCTFSDNSAGMDGGGMYNDGGSAPTLTNCTFERNTSGSGGGMYNQSSAPTLTNCTFERNTSGSGGGMYNQSSAPTLINCTFQGNSAISEGGGMHNENYSSPTLTNCTFSGNSATWGGGGGVYNWYSSPTLINCTFHVNSAGSWGGGMRNYDSSPTLTNCILWGNSPDQISNYEGSPVVTYSDIEGAYSGEGNIDAPPFFVDPANGDFHLRACSPCLDAGENDAPGLPLYDFEGDDRVVDGDGNGTATVDMGVDEVVDGLPCLQVYLPLVLRGY